jgi:hypothetical protein
LDFTQNINWAQGQPDNKTGRETCVHLRIFQNISGAVLTDRECKDKFIYACKVISSKLRYANISCVIFIEQDVHTASNKLTDMLGKSTVKNGQEKVSKLHFPTEIVI